VSESNLTVDFGDGIPIENINILTMVHTYPTKGLHNVTIIGDIFGFQFNKSGDLHKLVDIVSWGDAFFMDANSTYAFAGCSNLHVSAPPNSQPVFLSGATLEGMFMNSSFNSSLSWDLTNVTSLKSMFESAPMLNQPLTFVNSEGVNDTSRMFFEQLRLTPC